MNCKEFLDELEKLKWNIDVKEDFQKNVNIENIAEGRFINAPESIKELSTMFVTCTNEEDNIWVLSLDDYSRQSDSAFSWNEFELQSLEVAEPNEVPAIKEFWSAHFPFILSVKNGYSYIAVVLKGDKKGSIIIGNEPVYEDTSDVAPNAEEFFDLFIAFLKKEVDFPPFNVLK